MSEKNNGSSDLEPKTISKFAGILKGSAGSLNILFNKSPALLISLGSNKIRLDVHDPSKIIRIILNRLLPFVA